MNSNIHECTYIFIIILITRYFLSFKEFESSSSKKNEKRSVKGCNVAKSFNEAVKNLPRTTKKRIKYFHPYLQTDRLHWYCVYRKTDYERDKTFYEEILKSVHMKNNLFSSSHGNLK